MKRIYLITIFLFLGKIICAQSIPFILRGALKDNRQRVYRNIVSNTISKNLSLPLSDSTEENWQDAFWAMELINYKSAWTDSKIYQAINGIQNYSPAFQRALLELAYTNYQDIFLKQVKLLLQQTKDTKIFAMCAVYILSREQHKKDIAFLSAKTTEKLITSAGDPILTELLYQIQTDDIKFGPKAIQGFFSKDYLPGNVLMLSFQRKNRNYPGLVIIRDADGNFIKEDGRFFAVQQLARSITNLPGYLTNGNTPEGIFRMDGFDTSKSSFIGPTTNVQLTLPFEDKASHFYRDSTQTDSSWNIDVYKKLLPVGLKDNFNLFESYYAGKAGRTEIIAHGTTVDPLYYKNQPYYPLTPTQGCLCTKEIWSDETGMLIESDQQKLVAAIIKAGGPHGYAIVVNLDDQQKPVGPDEISFFLQTTNQK